MGSGNSSNSQRLVEVAVQAGARAAHLIDYPHEIQERWLAEVSTLGLTSGASVPDILVQQVLAHLAEHGWRDVQEIMTTEETSHFALPKVRSPEGDSALASRG